jgi:5-methylcytosine-specific restriction endonuclease McrA
MSNTLEGKNRYLSKRRYGGNREDVLKRDKYKCRLCGSIDYLCVHHIDQDLNNNSVENLITLCQRCHLKSHGKKLIEIDEIEKILKMREEGKTLQAIGKIYNVTRQRIHQIINNK